jgi:pimeloyl-ACP methyl ester carboxylesterase
MLYAIDKGRGFPVVLLHGFCENSSIWADIATGLESKYRCIIPDLPGHGKSPLPEGLVSLDEVAQIVHNYLTSLKIERFALIGHSLGGYVGLSMLEMFPESVKALGLFHSTSEADIEEKKANRNKTLQFIHKHGASPFKQTFIPSLYHYEGTWKETLTKMVMNTPVETIDVYTCMMRDRPDRLAVWQNAAIPSILVAGKYDEFIPVKRMEAQAESLPDSMFYVLDKSGHLGMWEQPEESLAILEKFLDWFLKEN